MAKKKHCELKFKGSKEIIYKFQELGEDLEKALTTALSDSAKYVAESATSAMEKHNRTHKTVDSIDRTYKVEKRGNVLKVPVGFHISKGGLASIFLMYGTPRMAKDTNLYNSIRGTKTRKKIAEIQKKAFTEAIDDAGGGS